MGDFTMSPLSLTSSKTGDSGTLERMIRPTTTSTMLARNGMRQASSPPSWTLKRNTRLASSSPTGKPAWTMPVYLPLDFHGCVFVAHEDGAAPFRAEGQALDDADEHQQSRGQQTDLAVGGEQADHESGDAHEDQGGHQDGLAADLVARGGRR